MKEMENMCFSIVLKKFFMCVFIFVKKFLQSNKFMKEDKYRWKTLKYYT